MSTKKINRRKFVTATAQTAAAAVAFSGCGSFLKGGSDRNPSTYGNQWNVDEKDKFDFIIVGSGAGGGPLAAGLAKAGYTVLLIEAGATQTNAFSTTPVFHAKGSEDPLLNWSYFVKQYGDQSKLKNLEKQNSKYQKREDGIYYPRASGLGGCTRVNALISLYPDHQDWQNLSRQTGAQHFSPDEMLKIFNRMQKKNGGWINFSQASPETLFKDRLLLKMALAAVAIDGVQSKNAVQNLLNQFKLSPSNPLERLSERFKNLLTIPFDVIDTLDGAALEGLRKGLLEQQNFNLDPNHLGYITSKEKMNGVFNIPFNATDGVRRGVREYLIDTEQALPNNLMIQSEALCTKIVFDPAQPQKAIGIEFIMGAHAYKADVLNQDKAANGYVKKTAYATREIILSGGAFNTPQLLMLSGVGPAEAIPAGIPLVKNLPGVGKNLQDRYEVTVVSELKDSISVIKDCTFARDNEFDKDPCWNEYQKNPSGHLYGTNGVALSLIRKSSAAQPTPDLCIFGLPGYFKGYYPGYASDTTPKKVGDPNYFTWAILKGHTKNHAGEVKLKSEDPRDTPEINFKYFHDEKNGASEDMNAVLAGLKVARDLNSKIGSKYFKQEVYPGTKYQNEADLKSWIAKESWGHHASCTSKMGPANDPLAVVDSRFKVHGIQNLRIVDASVFPDIPGLFIMLPTLMMSERAKDLILEDHKG